MSGYREECKECHAFISSGQEPFVDYFDPEEVAAHDEWLENWKREAEEFAEWHQENCDENAVQIPK
jgi:hypothetical protein